MRSANAIVVIRDPDRKLGAVQELDEETTNVAVRLKPAMTATGRVEDPDGVALVHALVGVWIRAGNNLLPLNERFEETDAQGRYEIDDLPVEGRYIIYASARGHGRSRRNVNGDSETNRVELPPFVLKRADSIVAGVVVDQENRPVAGADVHLSGIDQPQENARTDSKGRFRFKVCEGRVQLFASASTGIYANAALEAGETNAVVQLHGSGSMGGRPKRPALTGRPLPDLAVFGIDAAAVPAGKPLLLCLFDIGQRPSRRMVRLISDRQGALKKKGLVVAGIQASPAGVEFFKEWKASHPPPFPVGCLTKKTAQTRWASQAEALPWLILTDARHRVVAEGFALDELEAKLKLISN